MQLAADQALRKELLLFAVTKQPDLKAAMAMAAEMERFILEGRMAPPYETAPVGALETPSSDQMPAVPGAFGSGGTKRRWSEADDAALKELWHSAVPLEEIAATLERTTPSLYCRARALGFAKRAPLQKADPEAKADPEPKAGPQSALPNGAPPHRVDDQQPAGTATAAGTGEQGQFRSPASGGNGEDSEDNEDNSEAKLERYRSSRTLGCRRRGQLRSVKEGRARVARASLASVDAPALQRNEGGVDSIVQFLRSRDYSIVRVSEGRFRLDGRHVMSVDELRDKANQVRKSLGQPPFVALEEAEAVSW